MRNTKKGFTLVELLVVIAILAILATVSVVGYTNYIKNANESLALQELSQVKSSILAEDIVNNNFAIGSDGKVNAEGEAKFNEYLAGLANGLNGTLAYADGKVTYTLKKDTSVVYVLDLKTGEVEAGTATQTPVTPTATTLATFGFDNDQTTPNFESNADLTDEKSSFTNNSYTLELTNRSKVFVATDANVNGCLKLGTGSVVGTFTFEVPDNVTEVVIYVAGRQTKEAKITVNGVNYDVVTMSDNGEYTAIRVDTTSTKTVTFTTQDVTEKRAMIDKIEFIGTAN